MEDEFTAKMHSEFIVDEETDKKHRAGCVWDVIGFNAPKEDIEEWAKFYDVTYDICMKWKKYWKNLHHNSRR